MTTKTTIKQCRVFSTQNSDSETVLELSLPHPHVDSTTLTLRRDPLELVSRVIQRIQANVDKKMPKARKQWGSWQLSFKPESFCSFSDDDELFLVDESDHSTKTVSDLFQDGLEFTLTFRHNNNIESQHIPKPVHYRVERNPPRIVNALVTEFPLVNFPCYCHVRVEHATHVQFEWMIDDAVRHTNVAKVDQEKKFAGDCFIPPQNTNAGGAEHGKSLSVICTPLCSENNKATNQSNCQIVKCKLPIHALQNESLLLPMVDRVTKMGPRRSESSIRVMNYNIMWMTSSKAISQQGSGCIVNAAKDLPVSLEGRFYRQHILAHEILKYQPSIACLQEMTDGFVETYLGPILHRYGNYCWLKDPSSELVIFYDATRFYAVQHKTWKIADLLDEDINQDLLQACRQHATAEVFLRGQPQLAQAAVLFDKLLQRHYTIVNCHLMLQPVAEQMRALQAALTMRTVNQWNLADSDLIVTGDFNTGADCTATHRPGSVVEAAISLMQEGSIPSTHYGFYHGRHFARDLSIIPSDEERCQCQIPHQARLCYNSRWEKSLIDYCWDDTCLKCRTQPRAEWKEPFCTFCRANPSVDLEQVMATVQPNDVAAGVFCCDVDTHSPPLNSAYEQATGKKAPFLSMYKDHVVIAEARDHVFFDATKFCLEKVAEPVEYEQVETIPSLAFPSDHYSLVVDLGLVDK